MTPTIDPNFIYNMIPTIDLNSIYGVIANELNSQFESYGGTPASRDQMAMAFNGSSLSAVTELHLAGVTRGEHIGGDQTNYDVQLTDNSVDHWATKLEQRNMVKNCNLGPSTTVGKNRYFDFLKFLIKMNDCHSLIVYDLNSDPNNIDIYEIPTKLVAGLWKLNVIGTEVVIDKVKQGYRNAMVTYNQFKRLFPIEDYRFVINPIGHKMKDETPEECWNKAQRRKGAGQKKACVVEFDFDSVDFGDIFDED
jgi:hypothetical protein